MNETGETEAKAIQPVRNKAGQFVKGMSGNPRGMPRGIVTLSGTIRSFLSAPDPRRRDATRLESLVKRLYREDPKTLLAYGFGKPIETHEVYSPDGNPITIEVKAKELIDITQLQQVARAIFQLSQSNGNGKPVYPAITNGETSDVPGNGGS